MRSSFAAGLIGCAAWASAAAAGVMPKIDLPKDSPVAVLSVDPGDSNESARGGLMVLDLHAGLSLRNSAQRRIRGITLVVTAQDVTPGGKGSVTVTSLDVAPGDTFPIRIDLRLLCPLQAASNTPVQVGLDGVLFDDMGFYGPDKLNSRRTLALSEFEARRDRRYFKALLAEGPEKLRQEVIAGIARAADRPNLDIEMVRAGRATNLEPEKELQFAFLNLPDSPIEPSEGIAKIAGNEARAPRLEVRNRSERAVRYLEIGWILHDSQGRDFLAGAVPAQLNLAPGQKAQVLSDAALKFPKRLGQPIAIERMSGYVSNVEFADGSLWIPTRTDLANPRLAKIAAPSAEEQRLLQIYRKRGLNGLIDELKKF